ncbi:MAG: glutamate mutase L [Bacteroidota bacterium]
MPVSITQGDSLLAVDVGAATTRAVFFDVVDGQYRLIAAGQAPSTAEAPFKNVAEGVRSAIERLQSIMGRTLLDGERRLISPADPDGGGVDMFVATLSAGPTLRAVVMGLLADASVESARRLTQTIYARIVDTISLGDGRRADELIDGFLRQRPDLVVMTGGTDGGASRSIEKLLESLVLGAYLMPQERRPAVLFAGNQEMETKVREALGARVPSLHFSPNVRPSLETEDLEPAARELARLFIEVRRNQLNGVDTLESWSNGHILPTGYATGRMMRFLSRVYGSDRGILSVDIGASATMIAAGFKDKSTLGIYPQFGMGENLAGLLGYTTPEEILRWSALDLPAEGLRDHLYQKSLYPASIPATPEEQALSQAIAKQALYLAMQAAKRDFPRSAGSLRRGLTPLFDPIIAGGGALSNSPTPGQSLLLLLDAIQPVGVTTVILDQNNLLPLLGAAAGRNSVLPVHVLDSGAFMSLGSVVSPAGTAAYGAPLLAARLIYEDGTEARCDLKSGSIETLPLSSGQAARLVLQPAGRADAGFGPGREGSVMVRGGALGLVLDGRGRPLALPADRARRREMLTNWQWALGG